VTVDHKRIGAKIQYYRTLQGISQESLAEAASVSRRYISDLELGKKGVSVETLISIVNALRITADDILGDLLLEKKQSLLSMHFDLLNDCTKEETEILIALLQSSKQTLKKYRITK